MIVFQIKPNDQSNGKPLYQSLDAKICPFKFVIK